MNACYILYSPIKDKFYIGVTQDDVLTRCAKHNNKTYGVTYTSFTSDWEIFFCFECERYAQAVNIERHLKRMKSRKYIHDLKKFPDISKKLIEKYK